MEIETYWGDFSTTMVPNQIYRRFHFCIFMILFIIQLGQDASNAHRLTVRSKYYSFYLCGIYILKFGTPGVQKLTDFNFYVSHFCSCVCNCMCVYNNYVQSSLNYAFRQVEIQSVVDMQGTVITKLKFLIHKLLFLGL